MNRRRFIQGVGALFEWDALRGGGCAFAARNYTFYMFYTDKNTDKSKGEILSNQSHTSKGTA